ncbi:MAG: hypothetical protein WCO51_10290 [bacterium]
MPKLISKNELSWTPCGYRNFSLGSTATGIPNLPADAIMAIIHVEGISCRWRDDGIAPSASVGMPLTSITPFTYFGDLSALSFISSGGTVNISLSLYS